MSPPTSDLRPTFEITGGLLCLDFANTVDNRPTDEAKDLLPDYRSLVTWSVQANALSDTEASGLLALAGQLPADAARALDRAVEVREAIFSLMAAALRSKAPPPPALAILNLAVRAAFSQLSLQPSKNGVYAWQWPLEPGSLERPLWPIVRSAAELLASRDLSRVRICDAPKCDWLFLDQSKNGTRRWCDMKVCGNRDKARRFRAARKASNRRPLSRTRSARFGG